MFHVYVAFVALLLAVSCADIPGQKPFGPDIDTLADWLMVTLTEAVPEQPPLLTVTVYIPG